MKNKSRHFRENPSKKKTQLPQNLKIETEKLKCYGFSSDGKGIAKNSEGVIYFIDNLLPEEEATVEVRHQKSTFRNATIQELVLKSQKRQIPPCRYLQNPEPQKNCGGCQIQHVKNEFQSEFKIQLLLDALKRIGKIDALQLIKIKNNLSYIYFKTLGYRRRVRLHYNGIHLGFHAQNSSSVIPIQSCLLISEEMNTAIVTLREQLNSVSKKILELNDRHPIECQFEFTLSDKNNHIILHLCHVECQKNKSEIVDLLIKTLNIHNDQLIYLQHPFLNRLKLPKESFIQPHIHAIQSYVYTIFDHIHRFMTFGLKNHLNSLDLYCGSGMFTALPYFAAKERDMKVDCFGVEGIPEACNTAKKYLNEFKINIVEQDVNEFIHFYFEKMQQDKETPHFDIVILNPPRTGLKIQSTVKLLEICSKKSQILYLSCDAATFSRDTRIILDAGFELKHLNLFDAFGQTVHYETLGVFER